MTNASSGGGGAGFDFAGPNDRLLHNLLFSSVDPIDTAISDWQEGLESINMASRELTTLQARLRVLFGRGQQDAGQAAADAYGRVDSVLAPRRQHMTEAIAALRESKGAILSAQSRYAAVPGVTIDPTKPQNDAEKLLDPGGTLQMAAYHEQRNAREAAATKIVHDTDAKIRDSDLVFRRIAGIPDDEEWPPKQRGSGRGEEVTSGPLTHGRQGTPHSVRPVSTTAPSTTTSPPPQSTQPVPPPNPQTTIGGQLPTADPGPTTNGTLLGGPVPSTSPIPDLSTGSSPSGAPIPTSSAGPGSGPGVGTGVATAVGSGVAGGVGSVAASRPGALPRAVVPGQSGTIGRPSTASAATRGAIGGRGAMTPGQQVSPRSGTGSTGARTPGATGARAAGRSGMVPGQGAGSRGGSASGSRSGSASGGRTGRAGSMAPGTGGARRGKDANESDTDHLVWADEESWLDEEDATTPVID